MLFDGNITRINSSRNPYVFKYHSVTPSILSLKRTPSKISLNGNPMKVDPTQSHIILPAGNHQVELFPQSPADQGVETFGYISSSLFLIIGSLAAVLLLLVYLYIKFKK